MIIVMLMTIYVPGSEADETNERIQESSSNIMLERISSHKKKEETRFLQSIYVYIEQNHLKEEDKEPKIHERITLLVKKYLPDFIQKRKEQEPSSIDFRKYNEDYRVLQEKYCGRLFQNYQLFYNEKEKKTEIKELLFNDEESKKDILSDNIEGEKDNEALLIEYFGSERALKEVTTIIFDKAKEIRAERLKLKRLEVVDEEIVIGEIEDELSWEEVSVIIQDLKALLDLNEDSKFPEEELRRFIFIEDEKDLFQKQLEMEGLIEKERIRIKQQRREQTENDSTLFLEFPED